MGGQIAFVDDSIHKNAQGVADAIMAMGQAEAMRRDYLLSKEINKAISQGVDLPQIASMAGDYRAPRSGGVMGGLQGFGQSFAQPSKIPGQIAKMRMAELAPSAIATGKKEAAQIGLMGAQAKYYEGGGRQAAGQYYLGTDPATQMDLVFSAKDLETLDITNPGIKNLRRVGIGSQIEIGRAHV